MLSWKRKCKGEIQKVRVAIDIHTGITEREREKYIYRKRKIHLGEERKR